MDIEKEINDLQEVVMELIKVINNIREENEARDRFLSTLSKHGMEMHSDLKELRNRVYILENRLGVSPKFTLHGHWTIQKDF